ncbi:Bifunctional polymyxin resistance protein ArnA [compost metagenome]
MSREAESDIRVCTEIKLMKTQQVEPRVALFVDDAGYMQVLPHLPVAWICGIVAASMRPQYVDSLRQRAQALDVPLLVQPRHGAPEFPDFVRALATLAPNRLFSNSYSMIIRPEVLELVDSDAAFNVHAAALPRNRGPNPIQWALINGDAFAGVTIHQLDEGLDTGPVIAQLALPITDTDTWKTLHEKTLVATQELFRDQLRSILTGGVPSIAQDERIATKNPRLHADSPRLHPESMSDRDMFNWIRAQVDPLQGAYVQRGEERRYLRQFVAMDDMPALRRELNEWLDYRK